VPTSSTARLPADATPSGQPTETTSPSPSATGAALATDAGTGQPTPASTVTQ
jgi:hypothetical protein